MPGFLNKYKITKSERKPDPKPQISPEVNASKGDKGPKGGKKSQPEWMQELREGRSISLELFRKNAWLVILMMVTMIALMGLRYKTKTRMREINRLNNQLIEARSEMLMEKAEYMSLVRESEMERLVNEKGLGLSFQEQPPYRVSLDSD